MQLDLTFENVSRCRVPLLPCTCVMAPKKKVKGLAGKAAPGPGTALAALPANLPNPNQEWHKIISAALDSIKNHVVFGKDIVQQTALPMSSPDPAAVADERQQNGSEYVCAINMLWADPLASVTPGVPLMDKAISKMTQSILKAGPVTVEERMHVAYPSNAFVPGQLVRISPEEPLALHK